MNDSRARDSHESQKEEGGGEATQSERSIEGGGKQMDDPKFLLTLVP